MLVNILSYVLLYGFIQITYVKCHVNEIVTKTYCQLDIIYKCLLPNLVVEIKKTDVKFIEG